MPTAAQENVERKPDFTQVCVWPGTTLGKGTSEDFEKFMVSEDGFGVRVQFLEIIETGPDLDKNSRKVRGTGGRSDLFFAVHSEDVSNFACRRLESGIRWIEDALAPVNYTSPIYPERVQGYRSW